jgi:actin related protein 2/3 complex, subunit 2
MLLLDYHNKIIEDTILERFNNPPGPDAKWESIETVLADFDGVTFHMFTDANQKNLLNISVSIKCWAELKKYGVDQVMQQQYGANIVNTESNYDFTVQIDLAKPPQDKAKFAHNIALIKRHALAAPFYKLFNDIEAKKGAGPVTELRYRDEEAFFLKPESDRLIVIFSIQFKDADDVVFAKVFLQEFQDARRTMSNAPSVTYSQKEPPLELQGVKNLRVGDNNGYVSFVLFAPHITGNKKEKTIDNIQTFRNYLHYHIKCSKAYLHTRMRNRVRSFLQVLNRAKSEPESTQKRTITGRTFRRPDEPDQPGQEEEYNI